MKGINFLLKRFWLWLKYWLWEKPISKPPPEEPIKVKATEVVKEYMVVTYHGQRISMHVNEYPLWKRSSRQDKRAMKAKFEKQEREGLIRWEEIDSKTICIYNRDYQKRVEKAKEKK